MRETFDITTQDLDDLFEKYRRAPDSYVFVILADACRKIKRTEEALEICDRGVERHPSYASGHVVRGKCLYDLDRFEDAQDAFRKVLELDPHNLVALKFLGMLAADAKHFDEARRYLERILRLDPDDKEIKNTLRVLTEQERAEAVEPDTSYAGERDTSPLQAETDPDDDLSDDTMVGRDVDLDTSDEFATTTLADIFASQGYKAKALKIYRELETRQPRNISIKKRIAELMGDPMPEAVGSSVQAGGDETAEQPTDPARQGDETTGEHAPEPAEPPAPAEAFEATAAAELETDLEAPEADGVPDVADAPEIPDAGEAANAAGAPKASKAADTADVPPAQENVAIELPFDDFDDFSQEEDVEFEEMEPDQPRPIRPPGSKSGSPRRNKAVPDPSSSDPPSKRPARRPIDEKNNLSYFKRWLDKMAD